MDLCCQGMESYKMLMEPTAETENQAYGRQLIAQESPSNPLVNQHKDVTSDQGKIVMFQHDI